MMKVKNITQILGLSLGLIWLCSCGDSRSVDQLLSDTTAALEQNKPADEIAELMTLLESKAPGDYRVRMLKIFQMERDYSDPVETSRKTVGLASEIAQEAPEDYEAQYLAGRLFIQAQAPDEALPFLQKANQLKPNQGHLNVLIARAYMMQKNYVMAYRTYLTLSKMPEFQKSFEVQNELGICAYNIRNSPQAIRCFEKAIFFGGPALSKLNLARVYDLTQNYPKALQYYKVYLNDPNITGELPSNVDKTKARILEVERLATPQPTRSRARRR